MKGPTEKQMERVNADIEKTVDAFHNLARHLTRKDYRKAWEAHLYKIYARHGVLAFFKWRKAAEERGKIVVF